MLTDAEFNELVEVVTDQRSGEVRVLIRGGYDRDADTAQASGRGRTGDLKRDVTIPGGHRAMLHLHADTYGRMYVHLSETETAQVRDGQVIGRLKGLLDQRLLSPDRTLFLDVCYATWGGSGSVAQRLAKATGLTVQGTDRLMWTFPSSAHPSARRCTPPRSTSTRGVAPGHLAPRRHTRHHHPQLCRPAPERPQRAVRRHSGRVRHPTPHIRGH